MQSVPGTETRMSVGEDARIAATATSTVHNAAPRAPPSVDPLRTASMATGRIGAQPSTRGSATTTQTPAARHASNTRPPNQVSASAYRPLSAYLSVCLCSCKRVYTLRAFLSQCVAYSTHCHKRADLNRCYFVPNRYLSAVGSPRVTCGSDR